MVNSLSPAQGPDELGRLGTYRILQILGIGGMGVVFRAEDTSSNGPSLSKRCCPILATDASAKKRFLREAQAAGSIKHSHIVTIHQVGEENGMPFLAMEFLEGESLEDRLNRGGEIPELAVSQNEQQNTMPSKNRPSPRAMGANPCRWRRSCESAARSPRGWPPPTNADLSTATSSRSISGWSPL